MRIVQLANFYSPKSGGLRVAVDQLRAGYESAGKPTTLIVPGAAHRVSDGVVQIASPKLPNDSGYRVILSRRAVHDALDHADPDFIELHDKLLQRWVWRWAQQRSIPVVAVSHERLDATLAQFMPRLPQAVRARAAGIVGQRVLAEADLVVTCSAFAAAEYAGSPKVSVVPLGVDLKRFRPSADRADHPAVRLISVGRLSTEKRPDIAIGALAELLRRGIRAELTLMGSGPLEARLRRQAAGLPVQFTGFLSGEAAVAAQLAATDIALATGPAETFGLAALEGLACGIPTVTVEGAATAELVRGQPEAGRSATLDASAFADAVTELLDVAPADRRNAARDVAQRYPWSATVDRMRDLHRSVTHRTGDVAL